jgi:nicotinate-nucleotide adenylyltransferase
MAVGVFGGTFDPVHVAHLRAAEEAREAFSMERVYFVPAGIQPFKQLGRGAPAGDRIRMLEMATRGNRFFRTSQVEIRRGGVSYSIDTVKHFARRFGDIYFLVGMDAFSDIGLWKAHEELFMYADFVVTVRPGNGRSGLPKSLSGKARQLDASTFEHASGRKIHFLHIAQLDISSTQIRGLASMGKSIKYLVSQPVERYIIKKGLYRN